MMTGSIKIIVIYEIEFEKFTLQANYKEVHFYEKKNY